MGEVIIFDPYAFINFACCTHFLDAGMEVTGIESSVLSSDFFLPEKQLLVGRNANFKEIYMEDWKQMMMATTESLIVISFYDYYMSKNDDRIFETLQLLEMLNKEKVIWQNRIQLLLFLPVCFSELDNAHKLVREVKRVINMYKEAQSRNGSKIQIIYLPTVYGPWQPNDYFFHRLIKHQLLGSEANCLQIPTREYRADVIFIDDVVHTVMELETVNGFSEFFLKSKRENNGWQKGVEWLAKKVTGLQGARLQLILNQNRGIEIAPGIIVEVVEPFTPLQVGLKKQQSHLTRLLSDFR